MNLEKLQSFVEKTPEHGFNEELLKQIVLQYSLNISGIHGVYHWHRVYKNALRIAANYKLQSDVFMLFALFHDSKRANDDRDPQHGKRGGKYARLLQKESSLLKTISEEEFKLLDFACSNHTTTDYTHELADNIIAQICWDSDRLDIGRVGFIVDQSYLHTDYAKELANTL